MKARAILVAALVAAGLTIGGTATAAQAHTGHTQTTTCGCQTHHHGHPGHPGHKPKPGHHHKPGQHKPKPGHHHPSPKPTPKPGHHTPRPCPPVKHHHPKPGHHGHGKPPVTIHHPKPVTPVTTPGQPSTPQIGTAIRLTKADLPKAATPATLAFTGAPVGLYLFTAAALLGTGGYVRFRARRKATA